MSDRRSRFRLELMVTVMRVPTPVALSEHGSINTSSNMVIGRSESRRCRGTCRVSIDSTRLVDNAPSGHHALPSHLAMPVNGAVAQRVDDPRLAEYRLACGFLETGVVDQRRQVVLVWQLQRRIVLVGPAHREFKRATSVEARRARIAAGRGLGLPGRFEHGRPFGFEEGELAHDCAAPCDRQPSTWSARRSIR